MLNKIISKLNINSSNLLLTKLAHSTIIAKAFRVLNSLIKRGTNASSNSTLMDNQLLGKSTKLGGRNCIRKQVKWIKQNWPEIYARNIGKQKINQVSVQ
jgi:hypothetical protein